MIFFLLIWALPTFWAERLLILRIFIFWIFGDSRFLDFQVPRFPDPQKSGLGHAWARLGHAWARLGRAWAGWTPRVGPHGPKMKSLLSMMPVGTPSEVVRLDLARDLNLTSGPMAAYDVWAQRTIGDRPLTSLELRLPARDSRFVLLTRP